LTHIQKVAKRYQLSSQDSHYCHRAEQDRTEVGTAQRRLLLTCFRGDFGQRD
jgi:hypothetical protein